MKRPSAADFSTAACSFGVTFTEMIRPTKMIDTNRPVLL